MALAKETYAVSSGLPSPETFLVQDSDSPDKACSAKNTNSASSNSVNSDNEFFFRAADDQEYHNRPEEVVHSLIDFTSEYDNGFHLACGSFLSFDQNDHSMWEGDLSYGYKNSYWNQINSPRVVKDLSGFETATSFSSITSSSALKDQNHRSDWLYSEAAENTLQESASPDAAITVKRPLHEGESMQAFKRQCSGINLTAASSIRKAKPKTPSSRDTQSMAAKNRRERISERLKMLQELVPNGTKVDLVTMLEKAISYVKFLQLQVKVLATDEFWPTPGGKAPDISQVKEAIDAILSSHKERTSTSN